LRAQVPYTAKIIFRLTKDGRPKGPPRLRDFKEAQPGDRATGPKRQTPPLLGPGPSRLPEKANDRIQAKQKGRREAGLVVSIGRKPHQ
jgi:hypothetical protein